jgi:two-component system OmpR family response regulator
LVEDNQDLAQRLTEGLRGAGFAVDRAADGQTGYSLGQSETFDAIILDLGLPDVQGVDVLKRWRQGGSEVPVQILTARGDWTEKVEGLNAGADDYITKPCQIQEVAARLRALIRRSAGKPTATTARHGQSAAQHDLCRSFWRTVPALHHGYLIELDATAVRWRSQQPFHFR